MSEPEPIESPKTKLTLWVPEDVIEEAKVRAVRQKRSLSEIVTELLRDFLANAEQGRKGGECLV